MEVKLNLKMIAILVLFMSLLTACTSNPQLQQKKNCLENRPDHISGLIVEGARSEENVIDNIWPIMCSVQKMYHEKLKRHPDLKGTIEIQFSVEFNGEIGRYAIVRDTLNDEDIKKQLLAFIQFKDFDPYGRHNSETEITFPIHLKP
jgi:hypothetical protein